MATATPALVLNLGVKRLAQITALTWLAYIGFDLLMNAGVLARFYHWELPGFLPPMRMFLYIPLGWAAFLLHSIALVWLARGLHVSGARAGARFGAILGALFGSASFLGWMSILAYPVTMLFCWGLNLALTFTLLGVVIGSALAAARLRSITIRVIVFFLLCVIAAVVAQSLSPNPAAKVQHGRIGIGWDQKR